MKKAGNKEHGAHGKKSDQQQTKRIQRIKHHRLLSHFQQAQQAAEMPSPPSPPPQRDQQAQTGAHRSPTAQMGAAEDGVGEEANVTSPPAASPQNLSYYQQQLMHQRQLQRTGGLERLTADLAGINFNQPESPRGAAAAPRQQVKRGQSRTSAQRKRSHSSSKDANKNGTQANKMIHLQPQQQLQQQLQQQQQQQAQVEVMEEQQQVGGYEDQMTIQASQEANEIDLAREAQETNEDANLIRRFKIGPLVGTGNYARVYKAFSHNGRELAIKSINLSKTSDNYKSKFLPRELTILRKISHHNICKIHEIIHIADRVFIIMQFCSRGTIADLLHKHGPLSEPVCRHLFGQTNDAVSYLHALDIAHRDIKVENILLDSEFTPKLTDFSYSTNVILDPAAVVKPMKSARSHHHHQQQQQQLKSTNNTNKQGTPPHAATSPASPRLNETFCGTLPYLSPELIRQSPYDAKRTDIWSLGVCLYVMLNDRLPFPFNDIRLMIKRQLTKDYKFKANVDFSDHVRELVAQMLEPDFMKRPTSLEVAKHPWLAGPREKPPL